MKIADHFDNGDEFEDVLEAAEDEAKPGWEEEFVADWRLKWKEYGMQAYMSEKQLDHLVRISKT